MTKLLIKWFVKDSENINDATVRKSYGKMTSIVSIICNILLVAGKLTVGLLSASVSIVADAVNNLSDCASQIVSLISFNVAARPADKQHPFGHQRAEYIASLFVAIIIFFLAYQLIVSSIDKIINPTATIFGLPLIIVLAASILVKLWMFLFNRNVGKKINSTIITATSIDSISDVMATSVVLISAIISHYSGVILDGYMGIAVAIFIVISAIKIIVETFNKLLGNAPSKQLVDMIDKKVRSYPQVVGIHDLVVHSYGPNKCFATVHLEVDAKSNFMEMHDLADNIEREIMAEDDIHLVVHLDPVDFTDEFTISCYDKVLDIAEVVGVKIHDFRAVRGVTHSNLLFDVVIPYGFEMTEKQVIEYFSSKIKEIDSDFYAVINIDRDYT